ncbi:MAG: hypothetical protein AB7S78_09455 [Candidatus Omnitrophota bacterium]
MKLYRLSRKRAATMLLTLIFMVFLTVVASAYISLVMSNTKLLDAQTDTVRAFYFAEAGLNKAVWYLQTTAPDGSTDGSWRTSAYPADPGPGSNDPQEETLGDGRYTVWVETSGANILITARGVSHNSEREIQQEVSLTAGPPNIVSSVGGSWKELQG